MQSNCVKNLLRIILDWIDDECRRVLIDRIDSILIERKTPNQKGSFHSLNYHFNSYYISIISWWHLPNNANICYYSSSRRNRSLNPLDRITHRFTEYEKRPWRVFVIITNRILLGKKNFSHAFLTRLHLGNGSLILR